MCNWSKRQATRHERTEDNLHDFDRIILEIDNELLVVSSGCRTFLHPSEKLNLLFLDFGWFFRLDVLVYADMNSEPISHFLGYSRLARVQAVFWGNPITTGESAKRRV